MRWLLAAILIRTFTTGCECAGTPSASDAGVTDAGEPDAGPADAGPVDSGMPDAGAIDAGPADAGPADAGAHASGSMDLSFGDAGRVVLGISATELVFGVAVQGDGRVVGAGCADPGRMAFVRLAVDGAPDPTFGAGAGVVAFNVDSGTNDCAFAMALLPDGGILGTGTTSYDTPDASISDAAAARLRGDGSPETSFSASGTAAFPLGVNATCPAVALLPDGAAVLGCHVSQDFFALKVRPDGQRDSSFVAGLMSPSKETSYTAAVQPDGRVVVAGESDFRAALARFTVGGAVDTTFGDGGLVVDDLSPGSESVFHGLLAQPDGKLVGIGYMVGPTPIAVRYLPSGAHDPSFGDGGVAALPLNGQAFAGFLDGAGRVVLVGHVNVADAFFVARLLPSGAVDPAFGPDGGGITVVDHGGIPNNWAFTAAEGPDGRIIAGGITGNPTHFAFVRLWP